MRERPILFSGQMIQALLAGRKTMTRRIVKPQPYPNGFAFRGGDILCHNDFLPPSAMLLDVGRGKNKYTTSDYECWEVDCPYGRPGDRLWVRESLRPTRDEQEYIVDWHYAADGAKVPRCPDLAPQFNDGMAFAHLARAGVPSIHMPRWASRITLEVTGVRVERLQEISEADAIAEGIAANPFPSPWWQGYRDLGGELIHQQAIGETPPDWMIEPKRMRDHKHLDISAVDNFRALWWQINGAGSWEANPWVWVVSFRLIRPDAKPVDVERAEPVEASTC